MSRAKSQTRKSKKSSVDNSDLVSVYDDEDNYIPRIKSEYSKTAKAYDMYRTENVCLFHYVFLGKIDHEENISPITSKSKLKPGENMVIVTDGNNVIFFKSGDNPTSGYIETKDYRDTLLFDREAKTVFIARRNIEARGTRDGVDRTSPRVELDLQNGGKHKGFKITGGRQSSNKSKTNRTEARGSTDGNVATNDISSSDNEKEDEVSEEMKKYISSAIQEIDQRIDKLPAPSNDENSKPVKPKRVTKPKKDKTEKPE